MILQVAEILIQKSGEFNIKLNAEDKNGQTAFHMACDRGKTSIVEMMIANGKSFNLDLLGIFQTS